ncbi:MAG: cyclodeaminase/cyclohydrolase family protein [Lachnospiraceae bacterium]|jgi:formiminotetrahydrofolate cyclodeaminase
MENMPTAQKTCEQFINELASPAPAPGGGGAAALCGAIGIALGGMVASLTIGKKKYAPVEEQMVRLKAQCEELQKDFLRLVDKDAEGFAPLADAYRLPQNTPEEIAAKQETLEKCSCDACAVPLLIMEKCCDAIDIIARFASDGSRLAISDAGAGAVLCKAAMEAASLNIFINTKGMKDRLEADTFNAKAREMLFIYTAKANSIMDYVKNDLKIL